jgi:hypothetical protein
MFMRRCEILDFWHALEHAGGFARLCYGSTRHEPWLGCMPSAKACAPARYSKSLRDCGAMRPKNAELQETAGPGSTITGPNAGRMHYEEYLRLGYGIGSSAVESAHKQVVHAGFPGTRRGFGRGSVGARSTCRDWTSAPCAAIHSRPCSDCRSPVCSSARNPRPVVIQALVQLRESIRQKLASHGGLQHGARQRSRKRLSTLRGAEDASYDRNLAFGRSALGRDRVPRCIFVNWHWSCSNS